jgi:hypothetical protein
LMFRYVDQHIIKCYRTIHRVAGHVRALIV